MSEPSTYPLSRLAELVGGRVEGNPERRVRGVRSLESAGPEHLSFVTSPRYRKLAGESAAGALLVGGALEGLDKDLLIAADPYLALARILAFLYPPAAPEAGIHPTAVIGAKCEIDPAAAIGPYAVVGDGCRLAAGVAIHPHVVIGRDCRIGRDSVLYPRVVMYDGCEVGERCILHAGVVLGGDGFGYAQSAGAHVKLQHSGRVVVEDEVEIGANSTVDRALLDETRIGAGSKIDNLVQVAHNVRLGRACLLVAQSGIAGSTRLGDGVALGGQTGVSGHLELGDGAQVVAKSAVFKSIAPGKKVAGIPARDAGAWRREQALVGRLSELKRRIERLESKLKSHEGERS